MDTVEKIIHDIYFLLKIEVNDVSKRYTIPNRVFEKLQKAKDFPLEEYDVFVANLKNVSPLLKRSSNTVLLFLFYYYRNSNKHKYLLEQILFIMFYKQWVTQLYRYFKTGVDAKYFETAVKRLRSHSLFRRYSSPLAVLNYYVNENLTRYKQIAENANKTKITNIAKILSDIRNKMNQLVKQIAHSYMKVYKDLKEHPEKDDKYIEIRVKVEQAVKDLIEEQINTKREIAIESARKFSVRKDFLLILFANVNEDIEPLITDVITYLLYNDIEPKNIVNVIGRNKDLKEQRNELKKWQEDLYKEYNLYDSFKKLSSESQNKTLYAFLSAFYLYTLEKLHK